MRPEPTSGTSPEEEPARAPLRLLLVEDSEEDSFFLLRYLKRGDYKIYSERVDALEDLSAALEGGGWDAVVSDWELPGFDALDALRLVREKDPELPFIIVSGTIGEERAVEAMKAGAQDYVAKSNLARLRAAIEREMAGAEGKRQKRRAEEELKQSEARYRAVVEQTAEGIYLVDVETRRLIEANPSLHEMLGYADDELRGEHLYDLIAHGPEDIDENLGCTLAQRRRFVGERKYRKKDGSALNVEVGVGAISYGGKEVVCAIVRDVTERKEAEEALRESEEQFRASFDQAAVGMAHVSPLGKFLRVNDRHCEILGYERGELLKIGFEQVTHPEDLDDDLKHVKRVLRGEIRTYSIEKRYVKRDGRRVWVDLTVSLVRDADGAPRYFVSVVQDITERKLAELLPEPLTLQELEVLRLMARGKTNEQIAGELDYSFGPIKRYVRGVLAKLGVESRKQAAARAVEIGLLPPA